MAEKNGYRQYSIILCISSMFAVFLVVCLQISAHNFSVQGTLRLLTQEVRKMTANKQAAKLLS